MFLQQNNSIQFPLMFVAYLFSGSWVPKVLRWVPSHEMGIKSNQTVAYYFLNFCATIVPVYHEDRTLLQIKGFVTRLGLTFSSGSMQSTIYYHKHQSIHVKAIGSHQIDFFMFNMICRQCLQQQGFTISVEGNQQSWFSLSLSLSSEKEISFGSRFSCDHSNGSQCQLTLPVFPISPTPLCLIHTFCLPLIFP